MNLVNLSTKVVKDYENTIVEGYKGIVSERFLVEVTSQIITALTAEDTVFQATVWRRIGRTVIFFVAVLSYLSWHYLQPHETYNKTKIKSCSYIIFNISQYIWVPSGKIWDELYEGQYNALIDLILTNTNTIGSFNCKVLWHHTKQQFVVIILQYNWHIHILMQPYGVLLSRGNNSVIITNNTNLYPNEYICREY